MASIHLNAGSEKVSTIEIYGFAHLFKVPSFPTWHNATSPAQVHAWLQKPHLLCESCHSGACAKMSSRENIIKTRKPYSLRLFATISSMVNAKEKEDCDCILIVLPGCDVNGL